MTGDRRGGFTLLEVLLALSIIAAVLALVFGGLRIGIAAWRQGEDRAEDLAHARNLKLVLAHALAGTHAYRGQAHPAEQPAVLFRGEPTAVGFATVTPPFDHAVPVAYTAVLLALEEGARAGLAIRQKALPAFAPFEIEEPSLVASSVTGVRFRYLRADDGEWLDTWEPGPDGAMPRAVEVALTTSTGGRVVTHAPFTVPIRAITP